ncbi:hypothetical protein C5748_07370 [Phyllobacterium phragmitis]|uniref:Replication gene A protein-like domain-containing protein n=1 Tax=Phyllobacterium phragmitis TaxID=2670329 RepID=A0A2S9IV77_9HYPH|nr:replication endonuclease [Phyllobacterium phragmitis]PRD44390.1 hypothetical protein C5748_07370 [Phyllobacterium phragmitis]
MTAGLGIAPAGTQPPFTPRTKFVDAAPKRQGFSGLDVSRLGYVGHGIHRKRLEKKFAGALSSAALSAKNAALADRIPGPRNRREALATKRAAAAADAALTALFAADTSPSNAPVRMSPADIVAADLVDLDREEAGNSNVAGTLPFLPPRVADLSPEARTHRAVVRFLPPELAEFLDRMNPQRRSEREQAILDKVEWVGLEVLALPPSMLAERAEQEARRHAAKFPKADAEGNPMHQEPEHRKRRCEKWQLRRLRKLQRKALLYVEQAVGAVGGPVAPERALYLSDYGLAICEAEELRTQEILGGLRLVKKSDPSVQIPMLDLHWKAKAADAAKKRLLIDVHLARWAALGWHVCWLTVTLPGQYVAHATNEEKRVTKWDWRLGPDEASAKLQEEHHRTLNLLREKGVRLSGWWNVQPQQSGTPHRHYVVACETLEDARKVCDEFRARFSTGALDEEGQDRGCNASVIGDDNPKYAPRKGKNGKAETAESVARYAARYSTRYETRPAEAGGEEEAAPVGGDEQKRFRGWKKLRGARGMGFLGLDSQRAPMELWDVLWLNSLKEDGRWFQVEDARMSIAMREMRAARAKAEDAATDRATAKAAREVADAMQTASDTMDMEEVAAAVAEAEAAEATAREASKEAAFHGWHAAVAMGLWPDADLDPTELTWLNDAVQEWNQGRWALPEGRQRDGDPLPPVPLREARESVYGVQRNEIRGAVGVARRFTLSSRLADRAELVATAAEGGFLEGFQAKLEERRAETWRRVNLTNARRLFFLAARDAGLGLSRRPDGTVAGYDLSGEILMRSDDEWMIVEAAEAEKMRVGPEGTAALSFSATDPRVGPAGLPMREIEEPEPPPG